MCLCLLELVLEFGVFVLLVVVVTVILGVAVVKFLGDISMTGFMCNAYCPYILYASYLLLMVLLVFMMMMVTVVALCGSGR